MSGESSRSPGLHPVGSTVRLVGLKNPHLNKKKATIVRYTRDGERVMVSLLDEPEDLYKVRPRQVRLIEGPSDDVEPDLHRRHSPRRRRRRSPSRDRDRDGRDGYHHHRQHQRQQHQQPLAGMDIKVSQRGDGWDRDFRPSAQSHFVDGDLRWSAQSQIVGRHHYANSFQDNGSHTSNATGESQEIMETLRSAEAMFDLADTSGDGAITQEEFMYYMREHTDHDDIMILECFLMIDVDNDGVITREEVRDSYLSKRRKVVGGEVSEKAKHFEDEVREAARDADALFEKADYNGNGSLSRREFELYMKRNTSHSDAAIRKIFDSMDVDKNGHITREEVRKLYIDQRRAGKEKKSLMDILGLDDDEMRDIEDDVYNLFFLSNFGDESCWFAISVYVLKLMLVIFVGVDLMKNQNFPPSAKVPKLVKTTQFLLLPVNVSVQEELIATFYIYANLKWNEHILELNPGASKTKYHVANFMRFSDGFMFLVVNTALLLQAEAPLILLMNFTALEFLSSIDNVALHLARDGYLTEGLEETAGDVLLMKLPKNHDQKLQILDSVMFVVMFLLQLVSWIYFHFVRHLVG